MHVTVDVLGLDDVVGRRCVVVRVPVRKFHANPFVRIAVANDQLNHRTSAGGWILGHFIDPSEGVRHSKDVEVKWGTHPAGEKRPEWAPEDHRTTLVMLIQGKFHVYLTEGSAALERQGDYLVWGPGVEHSWEAEEDSIVITVRWQS